MSEAPAVLDMYRLISLHDKTDTEKIHEKCCEREIQFFSHSERSGRGKSQPMQCQLPPCQWQTWYWYLNGWPPVQCFHHSLPVFDMSQGIIRSGMWAEMWMLREGDLSLRQRLSHRYIGKELCLLNVWDDKSGKELANTCTCNYYDKYYCYDMVMQMHQFLLFFSN